MEDLKAGILRCVGEPETRFREDGLRILRALRFCAALDLRPHPDTEAALHRCRTLLGGIAAERIWVELKKLLCGPAAGRVLREYADVIAVFLPEITACVGFEHKNPWHIYDVWGHTVRAVELAPRDPLLRFALLLHDLGKPLTMTEEDGVRRFYGHTAASGKLARIICRRLRLSNPERQLVCHLVEHHDLQIRDEDLFARRMLNRWGEGLSRSMLAVYRADNGAKHPDCLPRLAAADSLEARITEQLRQRAVTDLRQLAVNGHDLRALGYVGPAIGQTLNRLLEAVLAGELENRKEVLLEHIKKESAR
jgi:tRNA nucleotidyltransferase (CCA-adding enzyme)